MAARSTDPLRQARIDRAKEIIGDALPDRLEPLGAGHPTTVIYVSGGTVTLTPSATATRSDCTAEPV